jgi:hypothetical protein
MTLGRNLYRKLYLLATALIWLAFATLAPAIAQDPGYHRFSGPRSWTVATNLPFVVLGFWGLRRSPLLGTGVLLTGIGSAYYHWSPSDATLVWDRLPMTAVFMALLALVVERWVGWSLRWPLLAFGIASVIWWQQTGDLRWYAVVQFGPMLVLAAAARTLWPAGLLYALSKLAETYDASVFDQLGIGGHALKHVLAAAAAYWILRWSFTSCATASPNPEPPPAATKTAS